MSKRKYDDDHSGKCAAGCTIRGSTGEVGASIGAVLAACQASLQLSRSRPISVLNVAHGALPVLKCMPPHLKRSVSCEACLALSTHMVRACAQRRCGGSRKRGVSLISLQWLLIGGHCSRSNRHGGRKESMREKAWHAASTVP